MEELTYSYIHFYIWINRYQGDIGITRYVGGCIEVELIRSVDCYPDREIGQLIRG